MLSVRPQKGPQTSFLTSKADVAIFGGAAGGGKSWALLLESLRHTNVKGYRAVIFRRDSNQIKNPGGLWDASVNLYPFANGSGTKSATLWNFPSGAKIKFSHMCEEMDYLKWQGAELDLICVARDTPILMGDGSYKAIQNIVQGDYVQTLQGKERVTRTFKPKVKDCVLCKTYDSKGNYIGEQIQPKSHDILTTIGWKSWDDLKRLFEKDCVATPRRDLCKSEKLEERLSCDLEQAVSLSKEDLSHIEEQEKSLLGRCESEERGACLKDGQTYCEEFDGEPQEPWKLRELIFPVVLHEPYFPQNNIQHIEVEDFQEINAKRFQEYGVLLRLYKCQTLELFEKQYLDQFYKPLYLPEHEKACVLDELTLEDFQYYYLNGFGQCGERPHFLKESDLIYPQQQAGVEESFVFASKNLDDMAHTLKHNLGHYIKYNHPYKKVELVSNEKASLGSCVFTEVGKFEVYDLTVEKSNHYITKNRLCNQNCFDELTHFSEAQFRYMFSRSRSTSGIKPYIRATTNPDSTSWVRKYIDWWIDADTGYAIDDRSGVLRYFVNTNDEIYWASTREELIEKFPDSIPKSLTFVKSSLTDNKILMEADPGYLANLKSMPRVERERLLGGNWNVKPTAGLYFQKHHFEVVKAAPKNTVKKVRYWDRAATKKTDQNDPDWTVGIRAERDENGTIYITDMVRIRESALTVQNAIKNTAAQDGRGVFIGIEQDPGQAGKVECEFLIRMLSGFVPKAYPVHKDKITRCLPVAAQSEAGNVKLVAGKWNDEFLREVENFPDDSHDDIVDALSGAHLMLNENTYNFAAMSRI